MEAGIEVGHCQTSSSTLIILILLFKFQADEKIVNQIMHYNVSNFEFFVEK